jgi:hypothetical protein
MKRKTKTRVEKFTEKVELWGDKLLKENQGYIVLAFDELEDGTTECGFLSRGKMTGMAESLYTCMKQNPMLEYVVMAAGNALAQTRMMQEQIQEDTTEIVSGNGDNQN